MTSERMPGIRPGWISDEQFPFERRFLDSLGGRMHHVYEGQGESTAFMHGNPSWSFEFRGSLQTLSPEALIPYRAALPDSNSRAACAALPGHMFGASNWLGATRNIRETFAELPSLVLWGHKDIAFRQKELSAWQSELANCECPTFDRCGHFLAEEAPDSVYTLIARFMQGNTTLDAGSGRNHG